MKSIGFVGLGAMGSVMAPLPVKAGFTVTGFDPAASLDASCGVVMATNLQDLASCDAIVLMLPDGTVVTKVATSLAHAGLQVCSLICHPANQMAQSRLASSLAKVAFA